MFTKNNFKQHISIVEDGDLKLIMNSRNVKKNLKFNIFKVMKLTFKIIFTQLLLRITFDDRF